MQNRNDNRAPCARRRRRGAGLLLAAALVVLAAVAAACGGDDDDSTASTAASQAAALEASSATSETGGGEATEPAATTEPAADETAPASEETAPAADETAAADEAPPVADDHSVVLKDGSTFTLADRIRQKVADGDTVNYVFSYQSSGIANFSAQYQAGFETTQAEAKTIYPEMSFKAIAPSNPQNDVPQQIAQILALADTDQIDCLTIEPANSDGFTQVTNDLLAEGVPVFTTGLTTNGNEFTNFTQVPDKEGATAAQVVLDFMEANGKAFKTFAVSGGDPTQFWAQGRMKGFREAIMAAIPDATFVTTEDNALNVTYDPAKQLEAYKAFLLGAGKDVDVIENVDAGAGYGARAIQELGLEGKHTLGWNVTPEQIEAIREGTQIALFDQKWPEQAGFGALACATFLAKKEILPNTQVLTVVTKDNLDEALAELAKYTGEG